MLLEPQAGRPYLSVVATARNDDHGGNLLGRMQIFIDSMVKQVERYRLPVELILVEWNPPAERPRLTEALRWPQSEWCKVRVIEVPREVHARYKHARALPLYQMIAKNVGIKRARGEFVLATNIDIVFSPELMEYLAGRPLVKGRMYRIDRHDVMSDVPQDGTLDEQIAYCRTHIIRHCAREGIFKLRADGIPELEADDIAEAGAGIHFGKGWFSTEPYAEGRPSRWLEKRALLLLEVPKGGGVLEMDLEQGPGVFPGGGRLQARDGEGRAFAEWTIEGRTTVRVLVPESGDGGMQRLELYVPGGGGTLLHDPRVLNFLFVRVAWVNAEAPEVNSRGESELALAAIVENGGRALDAASRGKALKLLTERGDDVFGAGVEGGGPGWHGLEQYGPLKLRWVGDDALLTTWKAEGKRSLALLVEPGPGVEYQPFELQAKNSAGVVVASARVAGLSYVELPLALPVGGSEWRLSALGGGKLISKDPRLLNFRVYACGLTEAEADAGSGTRTWRGVRMRTGTPVWDFFWQARQQERQLAEIGKPVSLHCNACGDFTLMSRDDWFEIRGYAELDQFSMHLDSILCYVAQSAGITEEILEEPMRIYHIEHGAGSGWTPEGESEMYLRIARKGIPTISFDQLVGLITEMRLLHAPVIFNLDDWGLETVDLPETVCP